MKTRLDLQNKLEELLNSSNVYYQPPESLKMSYPAIVYNKRKYANRFSNNNLYLKFIEYEIIVISTKPDNPVIEKILKLPYCSYERSYKSNGLNHDVLILYY